MMAQRMRPTRPDSAAEVPGRFYHKAHARPLEDPQFLELEMDDPLDLDYIDVRFDACSRPPYGGRRREDEDDE